MLPEQEREFERMKVLVDKMDHDLYGNGQPGIIQNLSKQISSLQRTVWLALGAFGAIQFLTASGLLSLKSLLGK